MVDPAYAFERRGVRVEGDGSIVLDRRQIKAPVTLVHEGQKLDHVLYHVANPALTAAFANPGQVYAYEAFGSGPILEPGAWRLALTLDGRPLQGYPPHSRVRGRLLTETWEAAGCRLRITSFCDGERNVVRQAFQLQGLDARPHSLEAAIRVGFLVNEEQTTYALHYDERYGAIVAILGKASVEMGAPEREPQAAATRAALVGADREPAEWRVSDPHAYLTYRLEAPPGQEESFCLAVTGGWQRADHEALLEEATRRWQQALAEAHRYADWLAERLEGGDPSLHSLFVACLNAAVSAYHEDQEGRFRGLVPSPDRGFKRAITLPADAYWCAQVLLPFHPEMVRNEIGALARAVHDDGSLALGVTAVDPADAHLSPESGPYDWWPAACDSPSYFAMLVHDYLAWTADRDLLDERVAGQTIWQKALACVDYLRARDTNHDYLFEKRPNQPDWEYDVQRDDWVTYDLALHYQALKSAAEVALLRGEEETARDLAQWAAGAQRAVNEHLWSEAGGHYVDYIRSYQGFIEDHASIDTLVAVLFGLATEGQSHRHLEYLERTLETRNNDGQYYGDWGVMNCFPFYKQRGDLAGPSAWAYSFHNGAAWPGWNGVYALAKLLHRTGDWRYPLERWWSYSLDQYWFTPSEYYSPPYDAPGVRQSASLYSWSAMPAAAIILGGFGFWPNLAGDVVLRVPPWGDSRLNGVRFRGRTYDVEARGDVVALWLDGERIASDVHGLRVHLGRVPASA